jgi:hypothetical protein
MNGGLRESVREGNIGRRSVRVCEKSDLREFECGGSVSQSLVATGRKSFFIREIISLT